MVQDYYKLAEQPFGVSPDPRYLYLTATHREALASLTYGISAGQGFMSLIAKPGMGKTTLLFQLLQQLEHSARTVFLFKTLCGPEDLLRSLLHDLGAETAGCDVSQMHAQLNECLLAESRRGKRLVVVIDEAQNLPDSALELLRMFSNFETPREKLMQIILAGQPQLAQKLASPSLVQLRQRIAIMARLKPFTLEETNLYVGHRLRLAGYDFRAPLFTKRAGSMIGEYSEGIPRKINTICFNALSLGCALQQHTIDTDVINEVMEDLDLDSMTDERATLRGTEESRSRVSQGIARAVEGLFSFRTWMPRFALFAMLLVGLTWAIATGRGSARALASQGPAEAINSIGPALSQVQPIPSGGRAPQGPSPKALTQQSKTALVQSGVAPIAPLPAAGRPDRRVRPATMEGAQGRNRTNVTIVRDTSELWRQVEVGKQSTQAEVELAQLYLEGNSVAKNCEQAHVLLLAASKTGSKVAGGLLASDYVRQCQ
jgi:general secretion pathway protein A